ncbi:MAG: aldehyde dehydrogenase family protein [PVC group bacterium]
MSNPKTQADACLRKAVMAAAVYSQLDQEATDAIVEAVFRAGVKNRVRLAKLAYEETGKGVWQDKVIKNLAATLLVYADIKDERTAGVISRDELTGITEIAQPLGPILGVIPVTNPTSTVMFKILISLKTRNPIIISPHMDAMGCCGEAARICYEAALAAGAPDDCVQWISEFSRELTHELMIHPQLALILATGGSGLVKAAYSSGTPALGVGAGNVPVYIEQSADIPFAITSIIVSKSFDNGTICASEQAVVVERAIADRVRAEFEKQNCHFMSPKEIEKLEKVAVDPESGIMNPAIVGQSASTIAGMAGIDIPEGTKLLIAPQEKVGRDYPLSGEILAPVLAYYVRDDLNSALKLCIELNYRGGVGHTASIFSNDDEKIMAFAELMNAGRIVVNTPSSQGAVGGIYNTLSTSFTLGCGAGGKNITTDNITARNLINIKRVCRRRTNEKFQAFPLEMYLDDTIEPDRILKEYNKNH